MSLASSLAENHNKGRWYTYYYWENYRKDQASSAYEVWNATKDVLISQSANNIYAHMGQVLGKVIGSATALTEEQLQEFDTYLSDSLRTYSVAEAAADSNAVTVDDGGMLQAYTYEYREAAAAFTKLKGKAKKASDYQSQLNNLIRCFQQDKTGVYKAVEEMIVETIGESGKEKLLTGGKPTVTRMVNQLFGADFSTYTVTNTNPLAAATGPVKQFFALLYSLGQYSEDGSGINLSAKTKDHIESELARLSKNHWSAIQGALGEFVPGIGIAAAESTAVQRMSDSVKGTLFSSIGEQRFTGNDTISVTSKVIDSNLDPKRLNAIVAAAGNNNATFKDGSLVWASANQKEDGQWVINTGVDEEAILGGTAKTSIRVGTSKNGDSIYNGKMKVMKTSMLRLFDIMVGNQYAIGSTGFNAFVQMAVAQSESSESELEAEWEKVKQVLTYGSVLNALTGIYEDLGAGASNNAMIYIQVNNTFIPMYTFISNIVQSVQDVMNTNRVSEITQYINIEGIPERDKFAGINASNYIGDEPNWALAVQRSPKVYSQALRLMSDTKIKIQITRANLTALAMRK